MTCAVRMSPNACRRQTADMNIYDKRVICCSKCDKYIGEVDYDAEIILPKCGKCANPIPAIPDSAERVFSSDKEMLMMH
jgi:hypothetical protein